MGLVASACFANLGHRVTTVECDAGKVECIRAHRLPIREPGLAELWERHQSAGRLRITSDYEEAIRGCQFVFIAVGTPPRPDGSVDLDQVFEAARGVARSLRRNGSTAPLVVLKSTVPVGTAEAVSQLLEEHTEGGQAPAVVSNPEFLQEGRAVEDFLNPARVIIGSRSEAAAQAVAALYEPLERPIVLCDSRTAEMIKYVSNAFLATKISFINEVASLAERLGVDIVQVSQAVGMDERIGSAYLGTGLGWGGSCLPKDLKALLRSADELRVNAPLLRSVLAVNQRQPASILFRLESLLGDLSGRAVAVWGLTFKPDCDDVRDSPAIELARLLASRGADVRAYDPVGMEASRKILAGVEYCPDALRAASGCDAVILATAWRDFAEVNLDQLAAVMRGRVFVDARNVMRSDDVVRRGFTYVSVGRRTLLPEGQAFRRQEPGQTPKPDTEISPAAVLARETRETG